MLKPPPTDMRLTLPTPPRNATTAEISSVSNTRLEGSSGTRVAEFKGGDLPQLVWK